MKSTSHRLLQAVWTACLVIVFLFPSPVQAADNPPGGPRTPEEMEAFFDQAIPEQLEGRNIPGAVVMAVKDGEVLFEKGYGMANLANQTPVDPESSVFHVASITKLFTWTAVMQLAEQGKLDLAADIQTYLDFEIPTTYDEPVTLQHLMTHTAGFEENNYEYVAAAVDRMVGLGAWLKSHIPARVRRPGEVTAYSNYGTALAGYIVERISVIPYSV